MRSNIKPENRRLLEAIEYIDEDIVLGVLAGLKNPVEKEVHGEYKKPSPFKHWKQFTAFAACLLLLSASIPVLNYAVQRFGTGIWEGNAGAGTSELEMPTLEETQTLETEAEITEAEVIDFDKALERYADMSAEEIYADVLKGGWIVKGPGYLGDLKAGKDLLDNFLIKTQDGEPATVLLAKYYTVNGKSIYLYEIVYNGDTFNLKLFNCQNDVIDFQGEYEYLKKGTVEYTEHGELYVSEGYYLTNSDSVRWDMLYNSDLHAWYAPEFQQHNDINYVIIEIVNKK